MLKPFLKWLGNKYRHIDKLLPILPQGQRLIEPFAGTCALFLNTDYKHYLLGEGNSDLVGLYQSLQTEGEAFIRYCQRYFSGTHNQEEAYYRLRARFNKSKKTRERAALFLYLNRHGYNGLCRYNQDGGFNVPFGRYKQPLFPAEQMRNFYHKSKSAKFIHSDYLNTLKKAKLGDVLYCDPPYVPLSKSANFTAYTHNRFGEREQIILAEQAEKLARQGIPVLISNHDTKFTRYHYRHAKLYSFETRRLVSCQGNNRVKVKEILALYH